MSSAIRNGMRVGSTLGRNQRWSKQVQGLTKKDTSHDYEIEEDSLIDKVEKAQVHDVIGKASTAITVVGAGIGAYKAGVAAGLTGKALGSAVALGVGTVVAAIGAGIAGGYLGAFLGSKVGEYISDDVAEFWCKDVFGMQKVATEGDTPARIGDPIAHISPYAAMVGAIIGALAVIGIGLLFAAAAIATGGLAAVAIVAAGGLVAGFVGSIIGAITSKAGQYGSNQGTIIGSPPFNVFFEGRPVARITDPIECKVHKVSVIAEGAKTVFANGRNIARVGHKTACDGNINAGCKTIVETIETQGGIKIKRAKPNEFLRWLHQGILIGDAIFNASKSIKSLSKPNNCTTSCGDPIDAATGDFIDSRIDFSIPATIPLTLERNYRTQSNFIGQLGKKWADNWSQYLVIEGNEIHFYSPEGEIITFYNDRNEVFAEHLKYPHLQLLGNKQEELILKNRKELRNYYFSQATGQRFCLKKIVDNNDNFIHFHYDNNGLTHVEHSDGHHLSVYSKAWRIQSVTLNSDDQGNILLAKYSYEHDLLTHIESQQTGVFYYQYDKHGRITSWRDSKNTQVFYKYDDANRVILSTARSGHHRVKLDYYNNELCTKVTYPSGKVEYYFYNESGLVTRQIDGNKQEWLTEWGDCFNVISETNPLGHLTQYKYDGVGNLLSITDPEGHHYQYQYNSHNLLTYFTDPIGNSWSYQYDDKGNLVSSLNPLGEEESYRLDENGQILRIDLPNGSYQRIDYDNLRRPAYIQDSIGHKQRYCFNQEGRLQHHIDELGNTTRYYYQRNKDNPRGALKQVERPNHANIHYTYDQEGQLASYTDAKGHTSYYKHGAFDLLEENIDPQGHKVRYEYDDETRLIAIINQKGERYCYEYDFAGNITKETDYTGESIIFTYDAAGRLTHRTNPDHSFIQYYYNQNGLLTRKIAYHSSNSTPKETLYQYDSRGLTTRIKSPDALLEYEYDELGRVIIERINGQEIHSKYHKGTNQRISRTGHNATLTFNYDHNEQLQSLAINQHAPLKILRDARGYEQVLHSPIGFTLAQHWNQSGLLEKQLSGTKSKLSQLFNENSTINANNLTVFDPQLTTASSVTRHYQWDKNFNPTTITDNQRGVQSFTYDNRQQITCAHTHGQLSYQEKFTYNSTQQIENSQESGHPKIDYQYTAGGRIQATSRYQYFYNEVGYLIEKREERNGFRPRIWKYDWDAEGHLIRLQTPTGERWAYAYDDLGRRIRKFKLIEGEKAPSFSPPSSLSSTETNVTVTRIGSAYMWDANHLIQEAPLYADGTVAWNQADEWIYNPDNFSPIAKLTQNDELFYVVNDHLGTPKELLTEDGKHIAWAGNNRLWGKHVDNLNQIKHGSHFASNDPAYQTDCPIRFQGQWEDEESGLHYNRFRYYDPHTSQYISPDPIRLQGGINLQSYVHVPNSWIDPLGLTSREYILQKSAEVIEQFKPRIKTVMGSDDIGIRGSVVTNVRHGASVKAGHPVPFNPNNFDIDAFVLNPDQAKKRVNPPNNAQTRQLFKEIDAELRKQEGFEGMRKVKRTSKGIIKPDTFDMVSWREKQSGSLMLDEIKQGTLGIKPCK